MQVSIQASANQMGTSMIEVLISLMVLAFGMLGAAAMQLASIRASQLASETSVATAHLYSMLEAIRTNADVARIGGYNLLIAPGCPIPDGLTHALRDLSRWRVDVKTALGDSACGEVQCSGNSCKVSIHWGSAGDGGEDRRSATVSTAI